MEFRTRNNVPVLITKLETVSHMGEAASFVEKAGQTGLVCFVGWLNKQTHRLVRNLRENGYDCTVRLNANTRPDGSSSGQAGDWDPLQHATRLRNELGRYASILPRGKDTDCPCLVLAGEFCQDKPPQPIAVVATPEAESLAALMKGLNYTAEQVEMLWQTLKEASKLRLRRGFSSSEKLSRITTRLLQLVVEAFQAQGPEDAIAKIQSGSWAEEKEAVELDTGPFYRNPLLDLKLF